MAEEIARFYTRSRRFPKMIGRMTDGSRIIGGPYTMTQVCIGGGVLMILLMTRTVWTTGVMLLDLVIVGGLAWGVTWLVGLIPITRRNLLSVLLSAVSAMFKPVAGTYKGRVPHLGNAHRVAGRIEQISLDSAPEAEEQSPPPVQQPERELPPVSAPIAAQPDKALPVLVGAAHGRASLSAVERLLQQAKNTKETN